jgi:hypothetical protein
MGADWDSLVPGPPGAPEGGGAGIYPDRRGAWGRSLICGVIRVRWSRCWCASAHVSASGSIRPLAPPRRQNGGACGPWGRNPECITPDLQGSWYLRRLSVVFIMNLSSGLPAGSSNAQGLPLEVEEEVKKEMPSGPQGIVDRVAKEAAAPLGKQLLWGVALCCLWFGPGCTRLDGRNRCCRSPVPSG